MPGGRLTHGERRRIAEALAGGLSFAEIARELGRPTSTISREVNRNGGVRGYRADNAHVATTRRARRPRATASDDHGPVSDAARDFMAEFAALMARTGMPRMAARVMAGLVTSDSGQLAAADLTRDLRVSPASVSKAVGYLESLDLIRRDRDRRRERYVIDDDVWLRTWMTSARTNALWADAAARGAALLGATTPAGARLAHMGEFFANLSEDMTGGRTATAVDGMLTVLAMLVHAGTPLTVDQLAMQLGWSTDEVEDALADAERRPDVIDPVILVRTGSGGYTFAANPKRLPSAR
jgi:DNA-binding transcriptional regulator GbsR (MarR family)